MPEKKLKTGVLLGGGPPPGYQWNIFLLDMVHPEAMKFLDDDQYCYVAEQVRELAREVDPGHSHFCDVDQIEDFFELREKYGPLGNINVRVFFFLHKESKAIVVLGSIKKENEGTTPPGTVTRMRRRKRLFLQGEFG